MTKDDEFDNTLKVIESEFLKFKNKVQRNELSLYCTLFNKEGYSICEQRFNCDRR